VDATADESGSADHCGSSLVKENECDIASG
jgi:hypothetical protein